MLSLRRNSIPGALGFIVLTLLLAACQTEEEQTQEPVIRPVITQRVELAQGQQSSYPATTEATERASLGFRVGGQIQKITVHPGESVKAGQVLAQLEPTTFQLQLDMAKAQAKLAQLEYNRGQKLLKDRTISEASFDEQEANLAVAKAELDTARKNLKDTQLIAPFDGVISFKHHNSHETVKPNEPILNLQANGLIDVTLSLADSRLTDLGDIDQLTASVRFENFPQTRYPAIFKSLDSEVNTDTGSYKLHFTLNTPESFQALPGMTALVTLESQQAQQQSITLPETAFIHSSAAETRVWVVDPNTMQVHQQTVEISDNQAVIGGLNNGDVVVLQGVHSLKEGQTVRFWQRERGI